MLDEQEHGAHIDKDVALFSNHNDEIDEEAVLEALCERVVLAYEASLDEAIDEACWW